MTNIKADFTLSDLIKWRKKGFRVKRDFAGCYSAMRDGKEKGSKNIIEYIVTNYIAYKPDSIEWYELIGTIHYKKELL